MAAPARLLAALVTLAQREPVTTIALDLGYDSPSAFIHAFRHALGTTPRRYFERTGDDPGRELGARRPYRSDASSERGDGATGLNRAIASSVRRSPSQ